MSPLTPRVGATRPHAPRQGYSPCTSGARCAPPRPKRPAGTSALLYRSPFSVHRSPPLARAAATRYRALPQGPLGESPQAPHASAPGSLHIRPGFVSHPPRVHFTSAPSSPRIRPGLTPDPPRVRGGPGAGCLVEQATAKPLTRRRRTSRRRQPAPHGLQGHPHAPEARRTRARIECAVLC